MKTPIAIKPPRYGQGVASHRRCRLWQAPRVRVPSWRRAPTDCLPRVPRLTRREAEARLSPLQLSFLSESRRLDNTRMKRELRVRLRYPTPAAMLADVARRDLKKQIPLPL